MLLQSLLVAAHLIERNGISDLEFSLKHAPLIQQIADTQTERFFARKQRAWNKLPRAVVMAPMGILGVFGQHSHRV